MQLNSATVARLKAWVPPAAIQAYWRLRPRFEFVDEAAAARVVRGEATGWDAPEVAGAERRKWEAFRALVASRGPLGFSHEADDLTDVRSLYHHNIHLAYGYALALAAAEAGTGSVSVLDWGGGLGHYYLLGRALVPAVHLDYHVKEMPSLAATGRTLLPDVTWHHTDAALARAYDLVLVNGSLQYMEEWRGFLERAAASVGRYFLLTRVPVVQRARRYPAVQRAYGTQMVHWQFREGEVLDAVESTGLRRVREILVGGRPYIRGAPEQPEMRGWLFRR